MEAFSKLSVTLVITYRECLLPQNAAVMQLYYLLTVFFL